MRIEHIDNFTKGWFIGNFDPSLKRTENFEIAYHKHPHGYECVPHYHKITTEYNYVISGRIQLLNHATKITHTVNAGDLFIIYPREIFSAKVIWATELIVVRDGSYPNDKYEVGELECV